MTAPTRPRKACAMPTTPPTDGRTARRTHTRARILAAAAQLMADRGITGTSMDDIAATAGVAKGSVFYNFGSKEALCRAVLEGGVTRIATTLDEVRDGRSGWAALDAAAHALLVSIDASPDMGQVVATELFRRGRPWQDDLAGLRERLVAPVVAMLAEVQAERREAGLTTVAPTRDHFTTVAVSFLSALLFAALDRAAYAPERSLDDLHASLMLTLSGLRA